jgi:hypothetical protein
VTKPAQNPPPPLFPKHRRGLYINGEKLEVIDATPQSPPLETDDPSVPDPGEYEINLLTDADLGVDARKVDVVTVDANYGLMLRGWGHQLPTQLKFEFPVVAAKEAGTPYEIGAGTPPSASSSIFTTMSRGGCGFRSILNWSFQPAAALRKAWRMRDKPSCCPSWSRTNPSTSPWSGMRG